MCVDDLVCVGAEPLFMLDYIATGKVDPDRVATVVAGVHEGCRQAGCALIGGETAEHPGVMAPDDLDLAGFAVGVVEQGDPARARARAARATSSSGCPRPGLRSNGYTLARHVLLERAGLEPGRPGLGGGRPQVADELLRPSVIYTPAVLAVRAAAGAGRRALTPARLRPHHGRRHRRQPAPGPARGLGAVLERASWEEPRIFAEIQRLGSVEEDEMDRVFNRGVGMALVVDAACGRGGAGGAGRGRAARRRVIGEVVERRARAW